MKIFTKKGILQKIIIVIIFVILFNFIVPNISSYVKATDGNKGELLGVLFTPVKELLLGVTDAVIWGINYLICHMEETFVDATWVGYGYNYGDNHNYNYNIPHNMQAPVGIGTLPTNLRLPMFPVSPEEIFEGKIPLLNVNFFNQTDEETVEIELPNGNKATMKDSSEQLTPIIAKWYYALRNFAIVMLLSVLVYVGIRIIISTSSEDRAKYKGRLLDWLIAMCLIFCMHYIMSLAVTISQAITDAVADWNEPYDITIQQEEGDSRTIDQYAMEGKPVEGPISWTTNLMGRARIDLQLMPKNYSAEQKLMKSFGYTVIYMGLVMYTVLFLFRYLKRLLMLTFLTIIAPLMAMTYPLDKIHDNKAQGFNTWLKEYIFNLLIQPVHLLLYTVLIGTAIDFVADNILYSLVAFGFILQAEKLMKGFFGFNKASTVSNTSAALGGALAVKGIESLSKKLGTSGKENKKEDDKKITQANRKPTKNINDLMNQALGAGAQVNDGQNSAFQPGNYDYGSSEKEKSSSTNDYSDASLSNELYRQATGNANTQMNNHQSSQNSSNSDNTKKHGTSIDDLLNEESEKKKKTLTTKKRLKKRTKYIAPRFAKGVAKGALKASLMATGGMIGLTAGLVSDDFSNVAKYGAAGIGAGYIAGNGIPNKITTLKDKINSAYEKEYSATHTKAEIKEMLDKKALKDKTRIEKYQEEFEATAEEVRQIMLDVQKYRDYGITDDDIIIKAMKTNDFDGPRDSEQRILLAKMASQVGGKEENYKRLKEGLRDRGISDGDASRYLKTIRTFNNWV